MHADIVVELVLVQQMVLLLAIGAECCVLISFRAANVFVSLAIDAAECWLVCLHLMQQSLTEITYIFSTQASGIRLYKVDCHRLVPRIL